MRVDFLVKRPGKGGRATFAIVRIDHLPGQKPVRKTLKTPEIAALNSNLKSKLLTLEQANHQVDKVIVPELKRRAGLQEKLSDESRILDANWKLFRKVWKEDYSLRRLRENSVISADVDFRAALKLVEPHSLMTTDRETLQRHWDKVVSGNRSRKYGHYVNTLLKAAGRDFTLNVAEKVLNEVDYLTVDDFKTFQEHLFYVPAKLLADVLFGTGVRIGEAFMFTERMLKPNRSIYVSQQMYENGKIGPPKNKPHTTVLLPQFEDSYREWCRLKDRALYRTKLDRRIRAAAKEAFPDPERQISPHDLRHSYAIHMLGMGLGLSDIAMLLGDNEQTVREHYIGFVMADQQIDRINTIVDNRGVKLAR